MTKYKRHLKCSSSEQIYMMDDQIQTALEVLKQGGVILYPTDTVWGLGCDATNADAVEKIYALKQRTDKLSMIVLIDSVDNLGRYVRRIPDVAFDLFETTDKPLTLILPGGVGVANNLLPDSGTIAIRIPTHNFCSNLIHKFRKPLVSTSANLSGEAAPTDLDHVPDEIKDGVDFIVDSQFERGATGKPSTIIELGLDGEFQIIRK